jgi:hypothetical protein
MATGSEDPEPSAVTDKGAEPDDGDTLREATGAPTWALALADAVAPVESAMVTTTVYEPPDE